MLFWHLILNDITTILLVVVFVSGFRL